MQMGMFIKKHEKEDIIQSEIDIDFKNSGVVAEHTSTRLKTEEIRAFHSICTSQMAKRSFRMVCKCDVNCWKRHNQ